MTNSARRFVAISVFSVAFAALSASTAHAQQFTAVAVGADVTVDGDTAHATFKIKVTSQADEAMTNCWLVYSDGTTVSMGDIDARGEAVSEVQERTVELTTPSSASVPLNFTIKFSQGDATVE